jgi:hypothetical protein
VPDLHHKDQQPGILYLVNDTVIANADAPQRFLSGKLFTARRARVTGQSENSGVKPALNLNRKVAERTVRTPDEFNSIH